MSYVGIDACRGGWVAVALHDEGAPAGLFAPGLAELAAGLPSARGFAVDIPIGLPTHGRRRADVLARQLVGARRSSVFHTPVREALEAPDFRRANEAARGRTGHGISQQAYALGPRILEAETWCRHAPGPVWEVHPEVSFTVLLGRPPRASKRSWDGMVERRAALGGEGIALHELGDAGARAGVDDVLDAAVAAWSARRLVTGTATSLPDPPEREPMTGRQVAIWA